MYTKTTYSDLGYTADEQKLPWCGSLAASSTQICRSDNNTTGTGFGSNRGAGVTNAGSPSPLDTIGGFVGNLLGGALRPTPQPGMPLVLPQSSTPPWLIPVALGGVGLVVILMLRRPRSNPARRRRSRSRARRSRR